MSKKSVRFVSWPRFTRVMTSALAYTYYYEAIQRDDSAKAVAREIAITVLQSLSYKDVSKVDLSDSVSFSELMDDIYARMIRTVRLLKSDGIDADNWFEIGDKSSVHVLSVVVSSLRWQASDNREARSIADAIDHYWKSQKAA